MMRFIRGPFWYFPVRSVDVIDGSYQVQLLPGIARGTEQTSMIDLWQCGLNLTRMGQEEVGQQFIEIR
jgi:hypothetical protein